MEQDTFEPVSALDFSSSRNDLSSEANVFGVFKASTAGKVTDLDAQLLISLKAEFEELIVTAIPIANASLLKFAAAGHATAKLDEDDPFIVKWQGYIPPARRGDGEGYLAEKYLFAKYRYIWGQEDFILYTVAVGFSEMQYVLKEPRAGEKVGGSSRITEALLMAIGSWQSNESNVIYVFDDYWSKSEELWKEVQKASWDKVILAPEMKKELVSVCDTFFDSKETYEEYGCPWKRGLIFHGPPGNGKTISIKALMHSMYQRKQRVPCLYVKSIRYLFMVAEVFRLARSEAPCLLIFEDMETIVTPDKRSYFFNEIDGLASNDGIMMIASTNYLDRLDPGLTKRPSRFDRKYMFSMPAQHERELYCEYWRGKIKDKAIDFPSKLCPAIASITDGFSFAYLQELFIASLLVLARDDTGSTEDKDDDNLDSYKLWRVIRKQVRTLRKDMDSDDGPEESSAGQMCVPRLAEPLPQSRGALPYQASGFENAPSETHEAGRMHVAERRPLHTRTSPPIHATRLTAEQAMLSLDKINKYNEKIWEWGPPPPDGNL